MERIEYQNIFKRYILENLRVEIFITRQHNFEHKSWNRSIKKTSYYSVYNEEVLKVTAPFGFAPLPLIIPRQSVVKREWPLYSSYDPH
jgi:hypothetical protein